MNARTANMAAFKGGRIGSATIPVQRIEQTDDSLWLQRLLTDKTQPYDRPDVIVICGGLAVLAAVIVGWLI